jgi:hypothetical protein
VAAERWTRRDLLHDELVLPPSSAMRRLVDELLDA